MTTDIKSKSLRARLLAHTVRGSEGCWLWTRAKDASGYGRVSIGGGKYLRTHKAAFVVFVGDVGEYDVLHRCDVRACCNPEHLYLGSHSDNMIDRVRRGRQTNTRMSKELVREILSWYIIGGWTQRDLAEAFGVTKQTLNDVVLGRTYSWLTGIQKKAG